MAKSKFGLTYTDNGAAADKYAAQQMRIIRSREARTWRCADGWLRVFEGPLLPSEDGCFYGAFYSNQGAEN